MSENGTRVSACSIRKLREVYPKASIVPFTWGIDLFGFPKAYLQPISPPELVTNAVYIPLARRMGETAGVLVNSVRFGAFNVAWEVCSTLDTETRH